MARRRKTRVARASPRRAPFRVRRSRKSSGSTGGRKGDLVLAGSGFVYGLVRNDIERFVQPVTSNLGNFGQVSDELVLGAAHYFLGKQVRNPLLKNLFMSGLVYEAGRAGELIRSGALTQSSSSNGVQVI